MVYPMQKLGLVPKRIQPQGARWSSRLLYRRRHLCDNRADGQMPPTFRTA